MSALEVGSCAEMGALLAERASGPLEAPEEAALEAHLLGCERCRAAAAEWEAVFSLLALPPLTLKEEAAMRGLGERTLAAWQRRERRRRSVRGLLAAAGILSAAALPLWLWQGPVSPPASPVVAVAPPVQLDWTEAAAWTADEPEATDGVSADATSDDSTLLDGLALEGDGAFALGDSG
ncbi:MAG: zf-HC2 domain-containing protein [Myxococcaceae bacterium]